MCWGGVGSGTPGTPVKSGRWSVSAQELGAHDLEGASEDVARHSSLLAQLGRDADLRRISPSGLLNRGQKRIFMWQAEHVFWNKEEAWVGWGDK